MERPALSVCEHLPRSTALAPTHRVLNMIHRKELPALKWATSGAFLRRSCFNSWERLGGTSEQIDQVSQAYYLSNIRLRAQSTALSIDRRTFDSLKLCRFASSVIPAPVAIRSIAKSMHWSIRLCLLSFCTIWRWIFSRAFSVFIKRKNFSVCRHRFKSPRRVGVDLPRRGQTLLAAVINYPLCFF